MQLSLDIFRIVIDRFCQSFKLEDCRLFGPICRIPESSPGSFIAKAAFRRFSCAPEFANRRNDTTESFAVGFDTAVAGQTFEVVWIRLGFFPDRHRSAPRLSHTIIRALTRGP